MKRFFLFLLVFIFLFVPVSFASDGSWVVDDFSSNIVVEKTGVVHVTETITTDFRTAKHGIYRDIPYAYTKENGMYYTEIAVKSVYQDNLPAKYTVSTNDANIRIKIGDADKTISGAHTYVIDYTAKGILQGFPNYDELYWNVTGNGWDVFIKQASAKVSLPADGVLQFACYQGDAGDKTPCGSSKIDEKTTEFGTTTWLSSSQGMTVALGYKKGMIPLLVVQKPKTFLEKFLSFPSEMTVLVVILIGFLGSFYLWFTKGRDYWQNKSFGHDATNKGELKPIGAVQTTVVEFTPPQNLRPAEMGILIDEKADTLDVVATIIDLTSRGYMTITEIPKKWIFGSMDYELKRTKKAATGLLSYETYLLSSIFSSGDTKKISTMKNTFYTKLAKVKEMMYEEMVQKGYFAQNPEKTRNTYTGIGVVILIAGVFGTFAAIGSDMVFGADIAVGTVVGSIFFIIFSRFMGRRSAKGSEAYRQIKGYQLFISTAEKYRQRFFEKKDLFTEVLPYAIVFGLTGKFAAAMKDIGLENASLHGYYGVTPFNTRTFGDSVNTFSSSFSSVAASAPSSSGSGGGGSSGGGFGGGGGGSW